jgi:hypothetical protein
MGDRLSIESFGQLTQRADLQQLARGKQNFDRVSDFGKTCRKLAREVRPRKSERTISDADFADPF